MATPTYTPLANITLGSSAAGVTFTSISQVYRDLILVVTGTANAADITRLRFNAATSGYSLVTMEGNGSATYSGTDSASDSIYTIANTSLAVGTRFSMIANIMDYSATDKHKAVLARTDAADKVSGAVAGRYASTSAITQIYCYFGGSGFQSGTSFALYGVAA